MDVAWASIWEVVGARNRVFPCKVAAADNQRLVCAAVAAAVVLMFFCSRILWHQAALSVLACAHL